MSKKPLISFEEALREKKSAPRPHDRPELKGSPLLILDLIEAMEADNKRKEELETSVSIPDDGAEYEN